MPKQLRLGLIVPMGFGTIFLVMLFMAIVSKIAASGNEAVAATQSGMLLIKEKVSNIAEQTLISSQQTNQIAFISMEQISLNAKEQSIAIQQVVDAMNSLNQAAAETVGSISKTMISTQQLNNN